MSLGINADESNVPATVQVTSESPLHSEPNAAGWAPVHDSLLGKLLYSLGQDLPPLEDQGTQEYLLFGTSAQPLEGQGKCAPDISSDRNFFQDG